jgi:hypothetical protein
MITRNSRSVSVLLMYGDCPAIRLTVLGDDHYVTYILLVVS